MRSVSLAAIVLVATLSCDDKSGAATTATAKSEGCTKDADCKGNRVCTDGKCVEPSGDTKASDAKASAGKTGDTKGSDAKAADAKAGDAKAGDAKAPSAGDAKAPAAEVDAEPQPTCKQLADHVYDVLSRTGSPKTKENLRPTDAASLARCEQQTLDPEISACFMAATAAAEVDKCNIDAFPAQVDGTPVRRIDALADNSKLDPPPLSVDGDYMGWDEHCGMLFREVPPAGAVFVVCDGQVKIGPIVNAEKLDEVMTAISSESKARHEMVMGIIDNYPKGKLGVKVHVYDAQGTYRGVEER